MPQIVVAAVIAIATYALTPALLSTFAAVVFSAALGAVLSYAGNALISSISGKPKGKQDASSAANDAKRTIRSEVAPRRIVYGRARVSGPLIYAGSFGAQKEYLLLVIPLADHEIEAIDAVWIGEHRVDASEIDAANDVIAGRFKTPASGGSGSLAAALREGGTSQPGALVSIRRMLGNQTQADPQLVFECPDGWTAADKLTGIAHLVVRLRYDPDLFQSGIPSISAEVRGKKVLDPRTGVTAYSDNWALCIHDYLRGEHGLAAGADEVNLDSIITAANLADEDVQITAGGATHKRYTLNGTFTLDRQPIDVIEEMLAPGGGALVYTAGQYRLFGGAYQAPTVTLTAADLASGVEVVTRPPRRELFNSVRGNFIGPDVYWQAKPFQAVQSATALAEDGEEIWREIELPWVLEDGRAQRIAKQLLLRSRQGVTIRAAVKYANLDMSVWQTVAVTLPDLGWDEKPFRIISWAFSPETGLITLTMQEEQIASYAWTFDEEVSAPEFPDTTLVDPFDTPAPINLTVAEELYVTRDGAGVRTKAILTWAPAPTPFGNSYDVEYKRASSDQWQPAGSVVALRAEVMDLAAGSWDFRVRARTTVAAGAWAVVRSSIGGLALQPPATVSGVSIQSIGGLAFLRWDRSTEIDVRVGGRYEIRHTPQVDAPSWSIATSIGDAVSGEATFALLPLKAGTYLIRAVDAGGVYGPVSAVNSSAATALAFANVAEVTEHSGFTGAKTDVVAIDGSLRLDSAIEVDTVADFDAIGSLDALGGIAPSGAYAFSGGVDMTTVKSVRLTSRVLAIVENIATRWDDRTADMDAWLETDGVFGGEADAWVEYRQTNDDPAISPVWSAWQRLDSAEASARAFQFRAQLRSFDPAFNINVTELSVRADEVA